MKNRRKIDPPPATSGMRRGRFTNAVFIAIVTAVQLAAPPSAPAHQKWLLPNWFATPQGPRWISFDVTWSDEPFVAEAGVGEQSIAIVGPTGKPLTGLKTFTGKTKSVAEAELRAPGTYRLEAVDPLTYWTRVEENGSQKWIKSPKSQVAGAKITRADLYWSKGEGFVTVGQPTEIARAPATEPLSIELSVHPNRIVAGEPIPFLVVSHGKPVRGAKVNVFGPTSTGHEPLAEISCDDEGRGAYTFPAGGLYLLASQQETEPENDPDADFQSFNYYLTLKVDPPAGEVTAAPPDAETTAAPP